MSAYRRACKLLDDVAGCPDEAIEENLRSLLTLREVLSSTKEEAWDRALFQEGLQRVLNYPVHQAQPALVGAAAGIRFGEGMLSEEALLAIVEGYLRSDPKKCCALFRGLLKTAREIAWQLAGFIHGCQPCQDKQQVVDSSDIVFITTPDSSSVGLGA